MSVAFHPTAPKLRRHYADAPHGQIHYYDAGGTGPALLLLHQSPASSSDWFALIPYFVQAGLRVVAMDTPGMGLSDPFPTAPDIQDYVEAVPMVLNHAGIKAAHLLGYHSGVQIGIELAVQQPQRVLSAPLYGAPVFSAEERDFYWNMMVPREKEGALHHPTPGGTNLTDYITRVEKIYGNIAAQRMLLSGLIAGPLWWHGHNAVLKHDMAPALLAARQPLLLISHPGEFLRANTDKAALLRPDIPYVSLPIEAAQAMDAAPALLAQTVIDFIAGRAAHAR